MKSNRLFMLLFCSFLALSSCDEDDCCNDGPPVGDFSENFGASVNRNFSGQIVDTNDNPLVGVTVKIGTSTVQTDENGVFLLNGASVYQRFAYVTATKTGYVDGSRALVPTTGVNHVKIMMLPLTPVGTVSSGETGEIELSNGTKVVFDGSFSKEDGSSYSGDVNVSAFHLSPSDENLNRLMPGMLYAQTLTNDEAFLETFGMINVELRGSAGEKLQITEGHTAGIELTLDDLQMASAPATIPLWHFDQQKGYWIEQGSASKVGNKYIGAVSHFSWWNCDAPFEVVMLDVTVKNEDGEPVSNAGIKIIRNGFTNGPMSYTNGNGQAIGLVPANESLTLEVTGVGGCSGITFYSTTVGPFTTDTTLPEITVSTSSVSSTTITGTIHNCDNQPIANGYAVIKYGTNQLVAFASSGTYSATIIYCPPSATVTVTGYDTDELMTTPSVNTTITGDVTNVQTLATCTQLDEYIIYQIDGGPEVTIIDNVSGFLEGPYMQISGGQVFGLWGQPNSIGTHNGYQLTQGTFAATSSSISVTITQTGSGIGDYLEATFTGTYTNSTGTHTLQGSVRAQRTF